MAIKVVEYDECVIVEGGGGGTPTGSDIKSRSHPLRRSQHCWCWMLLDTPGYSSQ